MRYTILRTIYLIVSIVIGVMVLLTMGCAKQYIPLKGKCLLEPVMEQVEVRGGTLDKANTIRVINNHVKSWEYIEYLKIKGCAK